MTRKDTSYDSPTKMALRNNHFGSSSSMADTFFKTVTDEKILPQQSNRLVMADGVEMLSSKNLCANTVSSLQQLHNRMRVLKVQSTEEDLKISLNNRKVNQLVLNKDNKSHEVAIRTQVQDQKNHRAKEVFLNAQKVKKERNQQR